MQCARVGRGSLETIGESVHRGRSHSGSGCCVGVVNRRQSASLAGLPASVSRERRCKRTKEKDELVRVMCAKPKLVAIHRERYKRTRLPCRTTRVAPGRKAAQRC